MGGFRTPIAQIAGLGELPPGFQYRVFDAAGNGQLVAVGLDCDFGGTRVTGSGEAGSIEPITATTASEATVAPAVIRHFTVEDQEVHGLLEFTADGATVVRGTGPASAQLRLDAGTPLAGFTGQHIFPAAGEPFTFIYRGLTACVPAQEWTS